MTWILILGCAGDPRRFSIFEPTLNLTLSRGQANPLSSEDVWMFWLFSKFGHDLLKNVSLKDALYFDCKMSEQTLPKETGSGTVPVPRVVRWMRAWERHPLTPRVVVNFINFLRMSGDLERRFLRDPLRSVPEFAKRISRAEQLRYGSEARSNQTIADMLLFAVEYAVGASVEGDVAEFGTMKGRTATVLAAAMAAFRHKGRLHLFDSFQGMPETSPVDEQSWHVREGHWAPGSCQGMGPLALRARCRKFLRDDQIVIYEGWYKDTVKTIADGSKFAVVHVDCDLYQSTIDALDPLFFRGIISQGAIILFDDWNCNRSSPDLGERRAWRELAQKYSIEFSDGGDYSWGGHKFIVHGYTGPSLPNSRAER